MELWDYQKDLLTKVEEALTADTNARVMMQLPTGGGKTVIAGELLMRRLQSGCEAVWMTHRRELADQTRDMLTAHGVDAEAVRYWKPGTDAPARSGGVVILMAQTVGSRAKKMKVWNKFQESDLMVIDEAHHASAESWERAVEQWPGQIVGMTATPWRLSEKEGFKHLFSSLICGPQIRDLQRAGHLCKTKVLVPPPNQQIRGGRIGSIGDYIPSGIREANRRGVWTAGARDFWMQKAQNRKTIAYAVSKNHARNLERVLSRAGISAKTILSDTKAQVRSDRIAAFRSGDLKVLVNVLVATEGFDLPDASCILVTRPTKSLALYMQMNGRGMRWKNDGGDCLILDMAYNSAEHGLPESDREWSLEPHGTQADGEAPMVPCKECGEASPASSSDCRHCGKHFHNTCSRCGKWRALASWEYEYYCGDEHDLVCDYCHLDAHVLASLPVVPLHDELAGIVDEDIGAREANRRSELLNLIGERERLLNDEGTLDSEFKKLLDILPKQRRPKNIPQTVDRFREWEGDLEKELEDWRNEVLQLSKKGNTPSGTPPVGRGWLPVSASTWEKVVGHKPSGLWTPDGGEIVVKHWNQVLVQVVEWLIKNGRLSEKDESLGYGLPRTRRSLRKPVKLSNGRFVETGLNSQQILNRAEVFLNSSGDPGQFYVRLSL